MHIQPVWVVCWCTRGGTRGESDEKARSAEPRRGSGNDCSAKTPLAPMGHRFTPPRASPGKWVMQGRPARRGPGGYTLIEILVATTLALMLMGAVVAMFARVGESINDARSMLEAADRLRWLPRLQADLGGLTVTVNPPRDPANNEGYLEYIEGPVVTTPYRKYAPSQSTQCEPVPSASQPGCLQHGQRQICRHVGGDFDNILMFTTRSSGRPFVGLALGGAVQSEVAEVAWFCAAATSIAACCWSCPA